MTNEEMVTLIVGAAQDALRNDIGFPNTKRRHDILDETNVVAACSLSLQLAEQIVVAEVNWTALVQLFDFDGAQLEEPMPGRQKVDLLIMDRLSPPGRFRPRMVVEFKKDAEQTGLEKDIRRLQHILLAHGPDAANLAGLQVLTVAVTRESQRRAISEMVKGLADRQELRDDTVVTREFEVADTENGGTVVFCGVYALPVALVALP